MKSLLPVAAMAFVVCGFAVPASAQAPLVQLLSRASSSNQDWAHLDGSVLMRGNQPVCAFGIVRIGKGPPQYTYFALFRNLPPSQEEFSVTGPLRSMNGDVQYQVVVEVGKRKIGIGHHMVFDAEAKKVSTDVLKVNGTEIKAGAPRVFLVDLSADPPTWKALDRKPPEKVLDPSSETKLDDIQKIVAEYVAASPELQAMVKAREK